MSAHRRSLTGWGRTSPSVAEVVPVSAMDDIAAALDGLGPRGVIGRGLGRSYGDPAQNAGGRVIDFTGLVGIHQLDVDEGRVTVEAGTSLDDLMRWLVPLGWFVPVTPGTRQVTVGGAIASDIHGKDHHVTGSWCQHVEALTIVTPQGGKRRITPSQDPDLFWATAGGMGLTGLVVDATIRLKRIETSSLSIDEDRTNDLDETMALMDGGDDAYDYSVAWIDLTATGRSMGRSILTRGQFATLDQLDAKRRRDPLAFRSTTVADAPRLVPPRLLNRASIRVFNELWYRKAPRRRRGQLQSITGFFHPLDLVGEWNRLYGSAGFLQWQCVVPLQEEAALRRMVGELSASGCTSFLAVLKRFGAANPGPLSFPMPGWTLALDIPADTRADLPALLDRLDDQVVAAGGRIYLAKDSRMRPELLGAMYPRLDEWRRVRAEVDPQGVLASDLGRRLGLA
ncbi:MAG: putative decaprenylphosphoryl-beta-D-ribose oxidase [Acidimicrobiales bacterium]|nr:putative decaprenylphosphoryl-beta-D-ribose oxidase [Acidimicrobiales bacterium]